MGRYISTGIIFQYRFSKMEIEKHYEQHYRERKSFGKIKQEIIDQLFPEIYNYKEDDDYLYVFLSDLVNADDLITTIRKYYSLVGINENNSADLEEVCEKLKGKTIEEAYDLAKEKSLHLFWESDLGFIFAYYAYPLVIGGKKTFYPVHASVAMIDSSPVKTATEDDLQSYDFFTDLLRYRMKPDKLADTMLIFLSL